MSILDEYEMSIFFSPVLYPPPPSFQGQFMSGGVLICEVIKAGGQKESGVSLGVRSATAPWATTCIHHQPSFPSSQRLLLH